MKDLFFWRSVKLILTLKNFDVASGYRQLIITDVITGMPVAQLATSSISPTSDVAIQHQRASEFVAGGDLRHRSSDVNVTRGGRRLIVSNGIHIPITQLSADGITPTIDAETKEVLTVEILRNQGWKKTPSKSLRETDETFPAHADKWSSAPIKDLEILQDRRNFLILESTQLTEYDGTAEMLARRLGLEPSFVQTQMRLLETKGYLTNKNGRLVKSTSFLEFQSQMSKSDLISTHEQAMEDAKSVMRKDTEPDELERRLITSCVFTCSRDQVPLLRAKIAEFLKETVATSAAETPEEVYQLGIQFFPATKK